MLNGTGPVIIANTLYYISIAQQIIFSLSVPDYFARTGILADSNVLVYVNGVRQVPNKDYIVDVPNNRITLVWPTAVGSSVIFDLTTLSTLVPPTPPPIIVANTLYYLATAGQTIFNLTVPDYFGRTGTLVNTNVLVYVDGGRLVPNISFTINIASNTITLISPAGLGSSVIFDMSAGPPPPGLGTPISMETKTIATQNVIPNLTYSPDSNVLVLFYNGMAFFATGSNPAFTVSGNVLTWTSTLYTLLVGATVIVEYTHA